MTLIKIPVYGCCMCFKQEIVPTLCFYNVARGKEKCGRDGSFYNDEEVQESCFIIFHLAEIVICVSLLSPCSLNVADGLQRSFVAFLYVPASRTYFPLRYLSLLVRFLTVFFILWLAFLFFFCLLFHEFFILHFISHLIYECLYNKLSYARILISSQLWSIGGQTYRWRHH